MNLQATFGYRIIIALEMKAGRTDGHSYYYIPPADLSGQRHKKLFFLHKGHGESNKDIDLGVNLKGLLVEYVCQL